MPQFIKYSVFVKLVYKYTRSTHHGMHIQIKILHLQLRFALTVLDTLCKLYLEIHDSIEMFEQINVFLLVS